MMPARLLGLVGSRPSSSYSSAKETAKNALHSVKKDKSTTSLKVEKADQRDSMEHLKRHSIGPRHSDKKLSSPKLEAAKSAKMDMVVESPPLVSYGTLEQSSGALFSAQLRIDVSSSSITLESFDLQLRCSVTHKKPVSQHCPDCSVKTVELKKWTFTKEPLKLKHGQHPFPFSYLFAGHLPATCHGALTILDYHLSAVAKTSTGETLTYSRPIELKRAIIPGQDKHSVRIFPPTNLTASVTLPPVIHPIGDFPVELRITGTTTKKSESVVRWRLRKLMWRIEEHEKMISPACNKHAAKVGGEGNGMQHEENRVIGEEDLKSGWKCDLDDGQIELEFNAVINPSLKPLCDVEAPNGLKVTHSLVIEMVVAEEWAPLRKPQQVTPTGSARILRTQFNVVVTERGGMGISWDEEQPPVYEDVPASPPTYTQMTDFDLQELDGELDHLHLGEGYGVAGPSSAAR